jgi:Skp family chaperone for outer membrane proteins
MTPRWVAVNAFAGCLAMLGCASTHSAPTSSPVAVVDMPRAVMECRDGRAAREDLMRTHQQSQALLDRHQAELVAIISQIKADRARGVDTREREAQLEQDKSTLQGEYQRLQRELSAAEQRRASKIQARLDQVLGELAAARHYGNVLRVSPAPKDDGRTVDVTSELIRAADSRPPLPPE